MNGCAHPSPLLILAINIFEISCSVDKPEWYVYVLIFFTSELKLNLPSPPFLLDIFFLSELPVNDVYVFYTVVYIFLCILKLRCLLNTLVISSTQHNYYLWISPCYTDPPNPNILLYMLPIFVKKYTCIPLFLYPNLISFSPPQRQLHPELVPMSFIFVYVCNIGM